VTPSEKGVRMKKIIFGAAVVAGAVASLRRFAPALHERAMRKCHDMMRHQGCPPTGQGDARTTPEDVSTDEVIAPL
jgi:hypothetical protein